MKRNLFQETSRGSFMLLDYVRFLYQLYWFCIVSSNGQNICYRVSSLIENEWGLRPAQCLRQISFSILPKL